MSFPIHTLLAITAITAIVLSAPLHAQADPAVQDGSKPADSAPDDAAAKRMAELGLRPGPIDGKLGDVARVQIPEGFLFADSRGTLKFLELTHNPTSGNEVGTILPQWGGENAGNWFVVFTYEPSGHVKDDDKDELDADALLATLKQGNEAANEERKKRGWGTLELVGWQEPPFYDPKTNNLTWATIGKSEESESVNWSTRLLGRRGSMSVDLVLGKDQLDDVLPKFETLMNGFAYIEGERYAEFKAGDKVAEYGLAALVAGGAGLVAAKTGILAKFWKFIVIGFVAVAGAVKKLFGFGKKAASSGEGPAA